ncbi:MAG: LPS-assembly protein LptD [Elusimicrobia bacterium]|nr:LPS-assembly protein LptD [Elusimicrobiota bacterium]
MTGRCLAWLLILLPSQVGAVSPAQAPLGQAATDYPLPEPPASHVQFSADQVDFDESSSVMHLKGQVLLREATWTVRADEFWIHSETRKARSDGSVFLDDGYGAILGSRGEFDLKSHEGWLADPQAGYGDWNVRAKWMRAGPGRRLSYRGARFSGCNVKPKQHYHLYSGQLEVVPKKYLLALNTVFFIGPVPVLYLPIFYAPLVDIHLWESKLQVGYDRRNGAFVKTTFITRHSEYLYSRTYVDGYTSQGVGIGGELHRRKGQDARGGLYGYWIHEQSTGDNRWVAVTDQYQAVTSSISVQARLHAQSDAEFNNHYARSKDFRVTPELVNAAAVVYRLPSAVARLSWSRADVDNGTMRRYVKDRESLPRLDVQSEPLKFWKLPWLNTLSFFADNSYLRSRGYQEKAVGAGWEASRTIRLARGLSFTPKVSYSQTYFDRLERLSDPSSTRTWKNTFVGRYMGQGNVRYTTLVGAWDLAYAYQVRHKPGALSDDAVALDHGVETNGITLQDTFRPARKILVRMQSGYEFRVFRDRYLGFRDRVSPLVTELIYTPTPFLDLAVRDDYQLEQGNRSLLFTGLYGEPEKEFISAGVGHNQAIPRSTFVNMEFGWQPSTWGWVLGGNLRSEVLSKGGLGRLYDFRLIEKELSFEKRLHDFHLRGMVRFRPRGVREYAFKVEMTFPGTKKAEIAKRDWEAEWFPERKHRQVDHP